MCDSEPNTAAVAEEQPAPGLTPPFLKETAEWKTRDTVFAVITFVCSVLFVSFSLFGGFAAGFTVSYALLFLLTALYMKGSLKHLSPFPLFCGAASVLLSGVYAVFDDPFTNLILFAAIAGLYGIFTGCTYGEAKYNNAAVQAVKTVVVSPFRHITEPFRSFGRYSSFTGKGTNKQIIMGIVISVPMLIVVIPLLISSDAVFESLMSSVFSRFGETAVKVFLGAVLSVFIFSLLFALKKGLEKNEDVTAARAEGYKNLPPATAVTLFTVLSAFYLIYLFSQLAYFFSAFSGLLPEGYSFTAAEYARRGFFELCGVCGINLGITSLITWLVKKNDDGSFPISVRIAALFICIFSVIFTSTALSKMFLYIGFYGLTRLRLLTSIFMLALILIFIGATIRLFSVKFPLSKYIVTGLTCIALTVGFCDIDRAIAFYNVANYRNGNLEEIDVLHLGSLSDSAVPYIVSLLDSGDKTVRQEAAEVLYARAEKFYEITGQSLKETGNRVPAAYNYSRERAKKLIRENFDAIKEEMPQPDSYFTEAAKFSCR